MYLSFAYASAVSRAALARPFPESNEFLFRFGENPTLCSPLFVFPPSRGKSETERRLQRASAPRCLKFIADFGAHDPGKRKMIAVSRCGLNRFSCILNCLPSLQQYVLTILFVLLSSLSTIFRADASVNEWEGETLEISRISRLDMGAYLCIASNAVPPTVSKRIKVSVDCKCPFITIFFARHHFAVELFTSGQSREKGKSYDIQFAVFPKSAPG